MMKHALISLAVVTVAIVWPGGAIGQPGIILGGNGAPAADSGDAPPGGGVYVSDSYEALHMIRQAERLARLREWDQAALQLHEAYTRYSTKLLAQEPGLYVGVAEHINNLLAKWPPEGLAVYRTRYDSIAKSAYEKARESGEANEMAAVARQYWASSIGAQAANEAAEMALEAGRFSAAVDLWSRLLEQAGKNGDKLATPPLLAKLAVAYSWNNQPAEAATMRDRLTKDFSDHKDTFSGGKTLVEWTEAFNKSLLAKNEKLGVAGDHPILGGRPDRNGIPPSKLNFGAMIWTFNAHKNTQPTVNQPAQFGGVPQPTGKRLANLLYPVLANGMIYLSSPTGVFALPAACGRPYLWHNPDIRTTPGSNVNMGVPFFQAMLFSPTYAEGRLYVEYGSSTPRNIYDPNSGGEGGGMVCLDAGTGKELWRLELDKVTGLKHGFVDSSPLVLNGRVYMIVHVGKTVFDEVTLLAADARTGKVNWQQPISSADSGGGYMFIRSQGALAAAEGNTIYFGTNMGTVAAVMAETGHVRWIRQYDRINRYSGDVNMGFQPRAVQTTNEFSPTIVWNGRVVVNPTDCADLLVLDARDGHVLNRINKKKDLCEITEVFGIVDGKLIGRGTQVVAWDLINNKQAWTPVSPDAEVTYRGQLTQQYLYLPTEKYLLRMDLTKQMEQKRFAWQPGENTKNRDGTILLSDQMIITVNPEAITGYCEWEQAEKMDLEKIADAGPDNKPDRILDYAGHAYMTRRLPLAKEQLSRAVEEAGGFAAGLTRPDLKLRVFVSAMEFANETWKEDAKATLELLQMASLCPPDVEAHVRYRMALAKYWEDNSDLPQAVRYYQEVLSDPTMRDADYRLNEQTKPKAAVYARDNVDRLIASHGAEVYQAVAEQADRDYSGARAKADWAEVERLIYQYPNATRTRDELFQLGEHLASQADYDSAINWLKYLRRQYPTLAEKQPQEDAKALTRMANYALALQDKWLANKDEPEKSRLSHAHRALIQAFSYVSSGRKLGDGIKVTIGGGEGTFPEHRARMQQKYGKQLQMLPQVTASLKSTTTLTLPQGSRLLRPLVGSGPATNDDIVLVATMSQMNNVLSGDLRGYRPGKSVEPLWTRKYDAERGAATNLVTYYEDNAIIVQLHRVKALNPENGDILWTAELKSEQQMGGLRFFARHDNFLLAAGATSAMVVDLESGKIVSQFKLPDMINANQVDMTDQLISFITRNQQFKVVAIDWRTGKVVTQADPVSPEVTWTAIAADNHVILSGGRVTIAANEVATGKLLWKANTVNQMYNPVNAVEVRGQVVYTAERPTNRWHVVARDVLNSGKVLWDQTLPSEIRQPTGMPMRLVLQDDELIAYVDNTIAVLDAEKGDISYVPFMGPTDFVRDLLITQDYLVVLCGPHPNLGFRGGRPPQLEVRFYDRSPGGGVLEQKIPLTLEAFGGQPTLAPANPGLAVQNQGMPKLYVLEPNEATPGKN